PAQRRKDRRRGEAGDGRRLSTRGSRQSARAAVPLRDAAGDTTTPPRPLHRAGEPNATAPTLEHRMPEDTMADKKTFYLPDLGEGLPDATIVEWFIKEGDIIRLDENLVSMETAKAVVDVPSPVSGKVLKLAGAAGDVVVTGAMLAEFEIDPSLPQRAEGQDTGHHH